MSKLVNNQPYRGKIVIHSSIIEEVSKYPKALDAVREFICNGWDADAEKIEITITNEFLRIEDWGTGITNFDLFWGVADQHKSDIECTPKLKRYPIGRKGLGKLSFSMLGDSISVETRTKHTAEYSVADFERMDFEVYTRERNDEVLQHRGTQITIRDLKIHFSKEELVQYIKENLYGLILPIASQNYPMKIYVNGEKIHSNLLSGTFGVVSTQFGDIHCNLTPAKTAKIDALYRGVKVREVNPAPTHPAKGYFNVNWVTPTLDRNDFTESKESRVFFPEIKKYILLHIPVKNEDSPKDLEKSIREITKFLDQILRDLEILPESMMPVSKTSKPNDLKMEGMIVRENLDNQENDEKDTREPNDEKKPLYHRIIKGSEKPFRSAFGILIVNRKVGKENPAIISYREEKLIIVNLDNELVKNLNKLRPIQRFIALGQLLVRGHFHILEKYVDLPQYEEYIDNMTSILFSKIIKD